MAQENFLDPPMPDVLSQWRHYLRLLAPRGSDHILDVGCGTGDALRLLLQIYPEVAEAVGLEKRPAPYAEAHAQAVRAEKRIAFQEGDAQTLPFADARFERVLCVDTLEWVEDPVQALREMRRVLAAEGTALIVHSDFDTQVFHAADRLLTRRIVHAFNDAGPNGQIGRELSGLCRKAGFATVETTVYSLVNTEWAPHLYSYRVAHMMVDWLEQKGFFDRPALDRWLSDLEQQHKQGTFFYSINRNICLCQR